MGCGVWWMERVNWWVSWFSVDCSCDRVVIVLVSKTSGLVPHGFESHRLRQCFGVGWWVFGAFFRVIDGVLCYFLSVTLSLFCAY